MAAQRLDERASGVLLHVSSLPSRYGCGDLGPAAHRFVEFLARAGQRWWQILPIGPCGPGNSPYQALSSFAGDPLFISIESLVAEGRLAPEGIGAGPGDAPTRVQYEALRRWRAPLLRSACETFRRHARGAGSRRFEAFCEAERRWLDDYALFCALRDAQRNRPWTRWDPDLRARAPGALARARRTLAEAVRYHQFLQYAFWEQWARLRRVCARQGIGLIGDVPFFVAHESAEVWAHPELFLLERDGRPSMVAGVPPDYFSRTGQRWGNPLYRWPALHQQGYRWWVERLQWALTRFDAVRLDHFIGFHRCWAVSPAARTARRGRFIRGPEAHLFETVQQRIRGIPLIAEDLGTVTPEVEALRDRFGFPGMRVLQFAFGGDAGGGNAHQPHTYPRRCVAYTGTHDNDTILGWFRKGRVGRGEGPGIGGEQAEALRYLGIAPEAARWRHLHWEMIQLVFMSAANLAIIPMQDLLGLGSEARMNRPGITDGNWEWRLTDEMLADTLAQRLHDLTAMSSRLPTRPASRPRRPQQRQRHPSWAP